MSEDSQKATVRRYFDEVLCNHNISVIDEITHDDLVFRNPIAVAQSRDGYKRLLVEEFQGFPDNKISVDYVLAAEDRVVCRITFRATFHGSYFHRPPTGRRFVLPMFIAFTFGSERIRDIEMLWDMRTLSEQIGSTLREKRL